MSVIQTDAIERAIRVVFNRDELRTRPAAQPPAVRYFGARSAIFPVDPISDGAWIAANDAGIAFAILNVIESPARAADRRQLSRGTIIPSLLESYSLEEAVTRAGVQNLSSFQPFRLLIFNCQSMYQFVSDGTKSWHALDRPMMWCSSGLGDELVEPPRRKLFDEMICKAATPESQDCFHQHYWPAKRHISVFMERAEAHTVSRTTLEISASSAPRMTYEAF